jgi:signal transduction histidine kinase
MARRLLSRLGLRAWLLLAVAGVAALSMFLTYVVVERLYYRELADGFLAVRLAEMRVADSRVFQRRNLPLRTERDDYLLIDLPAGWVEAERTQAPAPAPETSTPTFRSYAGRAEVTPVPRPFLVHCAGATRPIGRFSQGPDGETLLVCRALAADRTLLLGVYDTAPLRGQHQAFRALVWLVGSIALVFVLVFGDVLLGGLVVRPLRRLKRAVLTRVGADQAAPDTGTRPLVRDLRELTAAAEAVSNRMGEDRGRLERQLAELHRVGRELETAQRHLVQSGKLATIGELSAGIAHEIGNPLGVIQGYVSMLGREDLSDAERRDILKVIDEAVGRIERIVKDLLHFSRPSSQEPDRVNVGEVVRNLWRFLQPQKKFRNVRLNLSMESEPLYAAIPESRLHQILMNLFLNASDAMEGSGDIDFVGYARDGKVRIRVKDHGKGIPMEEVDKIFKPFYSTKGERGTGLGLTISNYLAELHGGDIEVESVPGKGSTFVLIFREANPTP